MEERVESNSPTHGVKKEETLLVCCFVKNAFSISCLVVINLLSDRIHRLLSRGLHGTCDIVRTIPYHNEQGTKTNRLRSA